YIEEKSFELQQPPDLGNGARWSSVATRRYRDARREGQCVPQCARATTAQVLTADDFYGCRNFVRRLRNPRRDDFDGRDDGRRLRGLGLGLSGRVAPREKHQRRDEQLAHATMIDESAHESVEVVESKSLRARLT